MLDTRKSLTGFAQLMLPALIDSENATEVRRAGSSRQRLLERAHQQIRRGAAGFKDVSGSRRKIAFRLVSTSHFFVGVTSESLSLFLQYFNGHEMNFRDFLNCSHGSSNISKGK